MKVFKNIPDDKIDILLSNLEASHLSFKKNMTVINNVYNANILSIIVKGSANIERIDYYGNRTIVEVLNEGDIFESRMFNLKNNELRIVSLEDTEVILIEYDRIINFNNFEYQKTLLDNIMEIMITYINKSYERVLIITKKTIREKLLTYFTILSNKKLKKSFYLNFNFTELASYLSVDRCALMREIKHLKEEGFISVDNKKITLNIEL